MCREMQLRGAALARQAAVNHSGAHVNVVRPQTSNRTAVTVANHTARDRTRGGGGGDSGGSMNHDGVLKVRVSG